jgi:hypothetical protein
MATKEKKRSPIRRWLLPVLFLLAAFPAWANVPRLAESRVWLPRDFAPLSIRADRDLSPETQGFLEGFNCELTLEPSIDPDGRLGKQFYQYEMNGGAGGDALRGLSSFLNNYNTSSSAGGYLFGFASGLVDDAASISTPNTYVNGLSSYGHNVAGYYNDGGLLPATSYALTSWNVGAVYSGSANFDLHYDTAGQPVGDFYQRGTVISGGVASTAGIAAGGLSVFNWATAPASVPPVIPPSDAPPVINPGDTPPATPPAGDATSATTPVGRSGQPMNVTPGGNTPATINGIDYSGHALDQMQGRGVPPSVVQNTINVGQNFPTAAGTVGYFDAVNNVRVIVSTTTGKVVTVIPGAP